MLNQYVPNQYSSDDIHKSNLLPTISVVRSRYYRDVERCQADSKPDFLEYLPIKYRTRSLMIEGHSSIDNRVRRDKINPLSLRILCHGESGELRNVLQPYIQQISSLTLYFFLCDKSFAMDDFHALKELTILKRGFDFERAIDKALSKLPVNLHRLDLTHVLFNDKQLVPDSAWARLTHIKIKIHELDEFLRLLRLCPNLSFLSMSEIKNPIKIKSPEPVTHANLEYFHMHGSLFGDYDVGVGLFNAITLPNLRLLDFRQGGLWPHGEFKVFVKRSKCRLESLILGMAMSLTDQQREECTSLLPSLEQIVGKGYSKTYRRLWFIL